MGDTFEIVQAGRETVSGQILDPGATVGQVLTVQADKSIKAAPGGGSSPVQAVYSGDPVTVADGAGANLTFDTLEDGTALLDITDPENPLFLTVGTYAITATFKTSAPLTAAGFVRGTIAQYPNAVVSSEHPDGDGASICLVAVVADASIPFTVNVFNEDGAASRNFSLFRCGIVKLA